MERDEGMCLLIKGDIGRLLCPFDLKRGGTGCKALGGTLRPERREGESGQEAK